MCKSHLEKVGKGRKDQEKVGEGRPGGMRDRAKDHVLSLSDIRFLHLTLPSPQGAGRIQSLRAFRRAGP